MVPFINLLLPSSNLPKLIQYSLLHYSPCVCLLFILSFLLIFHPIKSQNDMYFYCDTTANYTLGSAFQQNLNSTLVSLAANASSTGYYTTIIGQATNAAYGLIQCRGYVSKRDCEVCASTAVAKIIKQCANQKKAFIYNENCSLQYSDRHFFSDADNVPRLIMWNRQNATDPILFNSQLGNLLRDVSSNASADSPRLAVGSTRYTDFLNIYAMVQCTKDITGNNCLSCLQGIISYIPRSTLDNKVGGRIFSLTCNFRYEIYSFFRLPSPTASPPSPSTFIQPNLTNSTQDSSSNGGKSSRTSVILVTIAAVTTVVLAVMLVLCCCFFSKKAKRKRIDGVSEVGSNSTETLSIGLDALRVATRNFANANRLGAGGFGPVYKGKLNDGQEIAVKRLSRNSGQGLEELKTEVMLVAKLLHRNLVRLVGFCLEEEEKLLVYEYLPNGSLDKILFDENRRFSLEWDRRYKIIVGIARGLLYLHEDSQLRIVHRDMKASNILLDEFMNPKISDFGLARLFPGSQTQGNTNRIAGTYGYIAPEYAKHGHFSTKSDVYSFGILLLEIVTGQKNSRFRNFTNLQSYAWEHWSNGTVPELVDPTMGDHWPKNEVLKCIHIGLLCIQEAVADRPLMSDIIMMLSSYSVTSPEPLQPAFFIPRGSDSNRLELLEQSNNDLSITELLPR